MCTATFTHTVFYFLLQLPDANQHKENLVITRAHENRSRCLLPHAHKTVYFHYPVKKVCVSLGMWLFLVKLNAPINVAMHDSNERRTQNITTGKFKTCNIEERSQLYMSTLLACGTKKAYWRTVGGQNNRYVRNACRRAPPLPLMSMLIVGVDGRKDKIIDTQRTRI